MDCASCTNATTPHALTHFICSWEPKGITLETAYRRDDLTITLRQLYALLRCGEDPNVIANMDTRSPKRTHIVILARINGSAANVTADGGENIISEKQSASRQPCGSAFIHSGIGMLWRQRSPAPGPQESKALIPPAR